MNCKCNKLYIGLLIGLLLPIITSYTIFYFRFGDTLSIKEFVNGLLRLQGFTKLLSLSVIPNLLFFLMAIKLERLLAARGIVTATLLYAIVVVVFKFIL
ncbi:hypothetical protein SAMN06265379_101255 [Saccharicrinis carchari]|uniref:Uncharacterized protein n=1 Tax=Saccharicrinis carchari TaxID=1168039 RepID=A0A521AMF4_SACCC|nr:hypothetical protein [Saccharicrinis carchari]SMO35987.1 hypothetical protein SAMN06265379_101255 [Saccharicrinis carchari]